MTIDEPKVVNEETFIFDFASNFIFKEVLEKAYGEEFKVP